MDSLVNHHTDLPFPNGWFCVAWSKDVGPGEVKRVRYFGEELVVYRTRKGRAVVLDAYCPHLGAHLAEGGRVMGDQIRCPFHGWQFGPSGKCEVIPYCDRIPAKAKVRSWEVCERNRMIMVWHHAAGEPPSWEIPEMPELEADGWTEPVTHEFQVEAHMQEMAENNLDPQHFLYVHGDIAGDDSARPQEITYGDEGRFMRVTSDHTKATAYGTFTVTLERDTWGLGLSSVRMLGFGDVGLLLYTSTTPIDARHTVSRWLLTTGEDLADSVGGEFLPWAIVGVQQDLPIWKHKIYRPDPVLCEADKDLAEFRRWVKQFYSQPVTEARARPEVLQENPPCLPATATS